MARNQSVPGRLPTTEELESQIAPEIAVTGDAVLAWTTTGSAKAAIDADDEEQRKKERRRKARRRRRKANKKENGKSGRRRRRSATDDVPVSDRGQSQAPIDVSSLPETDIASLLGAKASAAPPSAPDLPGIDFAVKGEDPQEPAKSRSAFDDYETYYYGSDYEEGDYGDDDDDDEYGTGTADIRDRFFADDDGDGDVTWKKADGSVVRKPPLSKIQSVTKTPLASDFAPDDDEDEPDGMSYVPVFTMTDPDTVPFAVSRLGRGVVREMSTTLQRFLDGNVDLGQQMSALWRGFPEAYGITAGRQRYSGFAMRPTRALRTGRDFGEHSHMRLARIKSFDQFVHDLAEGDPYAIEFLGLEKDDILYSDETAQAIIESGDAFISKRCGEAAMTLTWDLVRKIGRPAEIDGEFGAERRRRAIRAVDDAKEDFTEAYGRFAKIYVDVQRFRGAPTVMASLSLRDMPLSEIGGCSQVLGDIARGYGMVSETRGQSALRGEELVHAMTEVVRILMTTSELLDGEGLNVYRDRKVHVLNGIMKGRLIGPDGRPTREYWDIVDEEQLRLEDAMERTPLPDGPDEAEVERLIASQNRRTVLEDA